MRTIDDVLHRLDGIIETCYNQRSAIGYFPALYKGTTMQIKQLIEQGGFEDCERLERLDVVFAARFVDAYDTFRAGGTPTESWAVAFQAAESGRPSILQNLLMGMNAHIGLDLGVATAQVCPGASILGIRNDFIKVNEVMSQNTSAMDETMAKLSPVSRFIEKRAGKQEYEFVYFDVVLARLSAWSLAEDLALCSSAQFATKVQQRDRAVAALGRKIQQPPALLGLAARFTRLTEQHDVRLVIDTLLATTPSSQQGAQPKAG